MVNMKKKSIQVLDTMDEELIEKLSKLGLRKNVSKLLVILAQVDELTSKELEQIANLRQPEVSVAAGVLLTRGWAKQRKIKGKGKGRPTYAYSLKKSFNQILQDVGKEKERELESVKMLISEVAKALAKS
jgi:predicted transcriptional regulator